MKTKVGIRRISFSLLSLFIGAAAWAQEGATINYFVSPEAWMGQDASNTASAGSDYTKISSNGNKMYVNIALPDSMSSGEASNYKVSDINSFSITTRQAVGSSDVQNAYFNIYTQKGEGSTSPNWYESRLNSEPYYATNLDKYTGAGDWYTWSTEDKGDNAYLTIYDSSANRASNGSGGFQGAYGVGATVDELKSGEVSITRPSETPFSRDYSQEKLNYISINVNDTNNNISNPGLDIKSFNMNLAGQDYAWNFLGKGSTWNVTGNQIAAGKISDMNVNVSGDGTVLTTQGGLSNSAVKLSDSSSANIDNAEYKGQRVENDDFGPRLALVQAGKDSSLNITNSTFEGNYAKSANTVNGTYGVAISSSGAKEVSIDNVKFNSNQVESESMAQGIVYISGTENASIKNSEFVGNRSGQESGTSYSAGVVSLWGNQSVSIEGSKFENNNMKASTSDGFADGGAIYARGATWGGYMPSQLNVKDSTFSGNTLESATSSRGGAVFIKSDEGGDVVAEIADSSFTNNKSVTSDAENAYGDQGGGAIYNENSTLKIVASKDITNVGNQAIVGETADDSRGGFLYMYSGSDANGTPKTEFAVAENATLTIGDGTVGQDSIASNDSNSVITKTGAGTLTVNGSMADYKGALNVSEGVMNVNNGLGGEANVSGAELNIANANYDGLSLVKSANGSPTAIVNATAGADLSLSDSSFTNNTVSTEGTANGTYGVAVGINASSATIDNVVFENNTAKSTGSLMSQGVVYLTASESTSVSNSKFIGNKSESETYALGGAISSFGSNLTIADTDFSGNSANGASADGAAVYLAGNDWGGPNPSTVNISDSTFEGNVSEGSQIARGAGVFAGGDNANTLVVNINDSVFTNNVAKGNDYVAGGAISVQDQMVNINVTKDMTYAGNQAIVNGVADDSRGGFLFINSKNVSSDTTFNISEGATLTIGDGREGYDSIASRDEKALINKTGSGTLTVNGSMEYYTGTLNVNEGTMNANNGLSATDINVASGATLNSDKGKWTDVSSSASWSNTEYYPDPIAEVSAGGTLNMSEALFENNSFVHDGSLASGVGTKGAIWVNGGTLNMSDSKIIGTSSVTNPGDKGSWSSTPNSQGGAILFNSASSSGSFSNVEFANNSASAMSVQGGAVAAFGGSFEFKDGTSFTGNKAIGMEGSTSSISGGAMYMTDDWSGGTINIDIANASFSDNVAQGAIANGGAIIYESYNEGSDLTVSDTSFVGNKAIAETRAEGGALRLFTTSDSEKTVFNDVTFANNAVEVKSPTDMSRNGGGAIYANASDIDFNVSKDAVFSGNYVSVDGVNNDELGGFMRLSSYNGESSNVSFNVSDGASLTIGDGTAGQDSIASTDNTASISKTGAGSLTVNGSMEYFTGSLAVNQGEMNVANKLGASSVSIASDAVLKLSVGNGIALTNDSLSFTNSGTLALIARGGESGKIAAASGLDFGNVAVYGGTFDAASGVFTSGDNMEVSYGNMGGSSFDGAATMKFSDESSSLTIISQGAISFGENVRDDSVATDFFGEDLLGAWSVSYDADDTIVMSFMLDTDISSASLYHQNDDGSWEKLDSWLTDGAVNIITSEMGNFAMVVPEPSTYALIFGAFALIFVISRRRK